MYIPIDQFEQFNQLKEYPRDSIIDSAINTASNFHEINDLEEFLLKILSDPNRTPHGPIEIADILTLQLTYRRKADLAAFVLNGRSFKSVTPSDISHQVFRLRKLADLKQGLPVVTTKGAAKRFKVGDDNFERHVILKKGEQVVADFYLGTSPSFKKVNARVHDQLEVVSIPLSTYELEADADPWVDRGLAKTDKEKINSLSMPDITLTRQDKSWQLAGLTDKEKLKKDAVDKLIDDVSDLTVQGVLDPVANAGLFKANPALTFTLTLSDGSKITDVFAKPEKKSYYVMKRPGYDFLLKINTNSVDKIRKFGRNSLVTDKETAKVEEHPGTGIVAAH